MNVNWYRNIVKWKWTHGTKWSIDLLKIYTKNILRLVVVYEVLIKPGRGNIHTLNSGIHGNMWLFWHRIFLGILLKRMGGCNLYYKVKEVQFSKWILTKLWEQGHDFCYYKNFLICHWKHFFCKYLCIGHFVLETICLKAFCRVDCQLQKEKQPICHQK